MTKYEFDKHTDDIARGLSAQFGETTELSPDARKVLNFMIKEISHIYGLLLFMKEQIQQPSGNPG